MKPFWNYYGGKWRMAPKYPEPRFDTIVEPFAGAAGYSMRYYGRNVVLLDTYAAVAETWRFLIGASPSDILAIPIVSSVGDLPDSVRGGARLLVGWTLTTSGVCPVQNMSAGLVRHHARGWMGNGWSEKRRARIAAQVPLIKHWRVQNLDYRCSPDIEATWFIDAPYERAGYKYRKSPIKLDFEHLATWCRERRGQVIVCEAQGAKWLPFEPFTTSRAFGLGGRNQTSNEVVWFNDRG
jgi:hypothetical protein